MKLITIFLLFLSTYCYSQNDLTKIDTVNHIIIRRPMTWIYYDDEKLLNYSSNQTYEHAEQSYCYSNPDKCRKRYESDILRIKLKCYPLQTISKRINKSIIHVGIRH